MGARILYCRHCEKYTLEKICTLCNLATELPRPPKFSVEDKYGQYRRDVKKKELQKKGLY
ncbi:MAG: nucleolar RNA-binding Nop10p family protein [Nanoarchaeota archaeon]|nr:nucleolar RNA-binding Nop10p family protein [Nanoarchaeota archaeon]